MEIILPDIFSVATCCTEERIQRTVAASPLWLHVQLVSFLPSSHTSPSLCLSPSCFLSILSLSLSSSLNPPFITLVLFYLRNNLHSCNWCMPPTVNNPNKSLCIWNLTLFVQWNHSTIRCSLNVELCHFKVCLMCFTREKACSLQKQQWDLKILPFSQTPAVYYWSVLGRIDTWECCSWYAWVQFKPSKWCYKAVSLSSHTCILCSSFWLQK